MSEEEGNYPFEVPLHDRMLVRITGKEPNTVLTIEAQFYTWRIAEYTEPISYGRHWCFEGWQAAYVALVNYITSPLATEPQGWIRATDFENGYRLRRAHVEFGERVITIDREDD